MPGKSISVSPGLSGVVFSARFMAESNFKPRGQPRVIRVAGRNPGVAEPRKVGKQPLVGVFVIGLASGHGPARSWTPDQAADVILRRFPIGGTIVVQVGWYMGDDPETSLRVSLENKGTGLADAQFKRAFAKMLSDFTDEFQQSEIWYDFFRGAKREGRAMTMRHV